MIVADTSLLVAVLRGDAAARRFCRAQDTVVAPTLVAWELWRGAPRPAHRAAVEALLGECAVEPFSARHAAAAGALQREHEAAGTRKPAFDLLIATHAVLRGCPVGTLDVDYDGIAGLEVVRLRE